MITDTERLVAADGRRREPFGTLGQVERVAMPMQHRDVGEVAQRRGAALGRQVERRPAYFLRSRRVDAGAERSRHELGAEADAERGSARVQARAQQLDFSI